MNPSFLLATIAAVFAGFTQANNIYIYSPSAASVCSPGKVCPIAWHVGHEGPEFERVDIELLAGDAQNATVVAPIVLGYDLSQGNTFMWTVPQGSLTEGTDYFIRIKAVGVEYDSYSHTFPIGFGPFPTYVPTETSTVVPTHTSASSGTVSPSHSSLSSSSSSTSVRPSSRTIFSSSSSSAMSVQGSLTVAVAFAAAAFAVMMF